MMAELTPLAAILDQIGLPAGARRIQTEVGLPRAAEYFFAYEAIWGSSKLTGVGWPSGYLM